MMVRAVMFIPLFGSGLIVVLMLVVIVMLVLLIVLAVNLTCFGFGCCILIRF